MITKSVDHVTLTSNVYKGHLTFWKRKLSAMKEPFLFNQQKQNNAQGENGERAILSKTLTAEVTSSLYPITGGKRLETTVTVLSALLFLLNKHNGSGEVIIKTPLLRSKKEEQKSDTAEVLIHEQLTNKSTVRDLLEAVQKNIRDTYKFQNFPFEAIESPHRDLFGLSNVGFFCPQIHEDVQSSFYTLDALFMLNDENGNLAMVLNYNTAMFSRSFMETFLSQLENVLLAYGDLSTSLNQPIFYSPAGQKKMLMAFNDTQVAHNRTRNIVDIFEDAVRQYPTHTAIRFGDKIISYGELNASVNRLARYMRTEMGVKNGDPVGIMMHRSDQIVIALMAVLKAGAFYVPIDPGYPQERISFIFGDTNLKALLIDSSQMFQIGSFENPVFVMDLQLPSLEESDQNLNSAIQASDLAYLIYTSGSTGVPKGVMVEHRGVVNLALWQARAFQVSSASNILQFFSYSFDGAVGETFMALLNGAALIMYNLDDIGDNRLIDFINSHQVHLAVLVPSVLKQMDPAQFTVTPPLTIISVGEECPLSLATKWNDKVKFYNAYGPTEYTVYSHYWMVDRDPADRYNKVPIGKPISNTQSYILDRQQQTVPVGVSGEICLAGEGMSRGYWNRPIPSIEKFVPNPFTLQQKYIEKGRLIIESARQEIEAFKKDVPDVLSFDTIDREYGPVSKDAVLASIGGLDNDIQNSTKLFLESYESDKGAYRGFCRYLLEGANRTYASCGINDDVLRTLFNTARLENAKGIDLGFGNGEIMLALERLGVKMRGMDLSPYFVQRAREKGLDVAMSKVDVDSLEFAERFGDEKEKYDLAVSTLLLDRVNYPVNYLKNLFFLLRPGGQFAFQTLLPVFPIDDSDVKEPIVYTQPEHRITPGHNIDQDKLFIIRQLVRLGASNIKVRNFPTVVMSRDGVQSYTIWSFAGEKDLVTPEVNRSGTADTLYRTGDIGRYLPDGNIEYIGRNDELMKIRGFRVEPGEVEHHLLQYPMIQDAVVVAKYDLNNIPYLAAYFVSSETIEKSWLIEDLKRRLPEYLVPTYFAQLDKLPTTPNGKIDKNALGDNAMEQSFLAPHSDLERKIAEIWKRVLGRDNVGVEEDFFSIGGHSLTATQVITKLHQELNVKLKVVDLFRHPTVRELAGLVTSEKHDQFEGIPSLSKREHYEVSHAQRSLWIVDQSGLAPKAFNMPGAYVLMGKMDVVNFKRAWSSLVQRHESLRTNIVTIDGEPRQVIHERVPEALEMTFEDVRQRRDANDYLNEVLRQEASKAFDLSSDALIHTKLFQVDEERFVFFYVMHHIISDGRSLQILMNDFVTLYNAFSRNEENPLSLLDIQYKDYASWANHRFLSNEANEDAKYWRTKFANRVTALELPLDRPRKSAKSYAGDALTFYIDRTISDKLHELAKRHDATLYMVLMTFVNTFLHRYTGQTDIVIGSPTAGRHHVQLENQVGLYLNAIAIRTVFEGNEKFVDFLARVKDIVLEAYQHQDYPFDKIVDELQLQWDANRSPLFDVLLMLQNNPIAPGKNLAFEGMEVAWLNKTLPISKYDLTFSFTELDVEEMTNGLRVNIEYNTDLFDHSSIQAMRDDFKRLVHVVIDDPQVRLSHPTLVGDMTHLANNFAQPLN